MVKRLTSIIHQAGGKSAFVSGFLLIGVMILSVANIVFRRFGKVIQGTYEITELIMALVVVAAFVYTTLDHGHVIIMSMMSRFSKRVQNMFFLLSLTLQILFWAVITWAGIGILRRNWLREETNSLNIPVMPFRFIWVFGLIFLCIIISIELFRCLSHDKGKK
jgi:TRAP-type C4-dicarboxylate transport system permease small subunit